MAGEKVRDAAVHAVSIVGTNPADLLHRVNEQDNFFIGITVSGADKSHHLGGKFMRLLHNTRHVSA
jgi:hypothetical protein